jgi:hypothetical protein
MPAPKGNTNALKHGLYAKRFNETQRLGLRHMAWDDLRHEEFMLRVAADEIYKLLMESLSTIPIDIDHVTNLANSLAICTTATGSHARTHALLNGKERQIIDALSEALSLIDPFKDERRD